ncbi:olfactory receptor 13H1-like [Tiliqua scincoides]|uniref:olfactory receptor 13H1-like n=1 Tax=Tiliqua scincoides TaxID=71010 RepID=UPI0034620A5D
MEGENETTLSEFIFIGYSGRPKTRIGLLIFMIIIYSITVVGNGLIILLTAVDPRLHTPMYFFLSNLSFLDIGYSTSSIPQAITNLLVDKATMSFTMCYVQMSSSVCLGVTECFLLAVMAYDRYIAISSPLHYMLVMSKTSCIQLAAVTWTSGFLFGVVPIYAQPAHFCGENVIDHFVCELKAVMKLVCSDTYLSQVVMFINGILTLLGPFAFILFSYVRILVAILRIHSTDGRQKAFSTCASHLIVVTIFYGTAIFSYLQPQTKETRELDKIISLFYGVMTPTLNPLIYTLRNQEVLGALRRLVGRRYLTKVLNCQLVLDRGELSLKDQMDILGVFLGLNLNLSVQLIAVSQNSFSHLSLMCQLHSFIAQSDLAMVTHTLKTTRPAYCNTHL